tara:strand:+ start:754 stop:2220 length:1467 start_codon:yes stop_codon:yes gene_type:complete
MDDQFKYKHFLLGTLLLVVLAVFLNNDDIHADTKNIEILSYGVVSQFPDGLKFEVHVESASLVEEIALRFKVGHQKSGVYEYFEFEPSEKVETSLFWNTNTASKYIPPGTNIKYSVSATNSVGESTESEETNFTYTDVRYEWDEVSEDGITVFYHGPVKARAQAILDSILQTMLYTEPVFGEQQKESIRVSMYNNVKEMLNALPPNSSTIRKELITEGQAFPDIGTLLVLGGGRLSVGTASHEVAHILIHRAGDSVYGNVPAWLDEGLAELANVSPSFSYDIALDFAVHSDRLLPITSMPRLPGNPEDVIIFYGQAKSIVEFMVVRYGVDKMKLLMSTMKSGINTDEAIKEVYEVERIELENLWREYIGAPIYIPPPDDYELPTPVPIKSISLYTLTPEAGGSVVKSNQTGNTEDNSDDRTENIESIDTADSINSLNSEAAQTNESVKETFNSCSKGTNSSYKDISDIGLMFLIILFASKGTTPFKDI